MFCCISRIQARPLTNDKIYLFESLKRKINIFLGLRQINNLLILESALLNNALGNRSVYYYHFKMNGFKINK